MSLFQFLQTPTWDYKKMDQSLLLLSNRKKVTNTLKGGVGVKGQYEFNWVLWCNF